MGHWARDCRKKKHDEAQRGMANLSVEEDADPAMRTGHVIEVTEPGVELHTTAAEIGEFPAAGDAPIRSGSHFLYNKEHAKVQPLRRCLGSGVVPGLRRHEPHGMRQGRLR
jgi:hypothetical protein